MDSGAAPTTDRGTTVALRMPALGADMTEGRIVEWLVGPGDHVDRGEIVAVVETDKADIEIEVFQEATIGRFLVDTGELVPVGTPIAELETARRSTSGHTDDHAAAAVPDRRPAEATPSRVSSPLVRHLADERHVDMAALHGSGPGGRITRSDVEHAAAPSAPSAGAIVRSGGTGRTRITPRARRLAREDGITHDRLVALAVGGRPVTGGDVLNARSDQSRSGPPDRASSTVDPMRRRIAELMSRSWREIPHYHLERRLDVGAVLGRLRARNERRSLADRILPAALLLAAVAAAARRVPECNGWWRDDRFEPSEHVDIGVVLSLRSGGLIVPTIAAADELGIDDLMGRLREVVDRSRRGRLRGSDLADASITVTNLGDQGADAVFGVIHPPQVAIVGFGAVRDDVLVDSTTPENVRITRTVRSTLSGDHRATDGLTGSVFLAEVDRALDRLLREET